MAGGPTGVYSAEIIDGNYVISIPIEQDVTGITRSDNARLMTTGSLPITENGCPRADGLRISCTLSRNWRPGERREWEERQRRLAE